MMDDDFFLNDDDLAADNQLSIVDEAKIKLAKEIEKVAKDLEENINYNEKSDSENNLKILSNHLTALISMFEIDTFNLSDEEIQERIDEVIKQTTQLTFANIDDVIPEMEESTDTQVSDDNDDNLDW